MVAMITVWENGEPVTRPALPGEIPQPDPADALAARRAAMRCSPATMRLVLRWIGFRQAVEAIADSDPDASDVWEYGVEFYRNSPLIEALSNNPLQTFTPEQIDAIFEACTAYEAGQLTKEQIIAAFD